MARSSTCVSCEVGHYDCLLFALQNGCPRGDCALEAAVKKGHLRSVELLVAHGLPERPITFAAAKGEKATADQLRCLQHILDKGSSVDARTVTCAAQAGDVDLVRFLHTRGVRLWEEACEAETKSSAFLLYFSSKTRVVVPTVLKNAALMWDALRYGWAMGAPVTPAMAEAFKAKRAATCATLLCFHVATRLSEGRGAAGEQGAAWGGMGRVPVELIEKLLLQADFEIPETLRRSLPRDSCGVLVDVRPPHMVWMRY